MQQFPELTESSFKKTRKQIHSAAKVIGKFREKLVKPIAKNDNLWLTIVDQGFCTPPMGELNDLEIGCSLEKLIIEAANDRNKYHSFDINGKTASSLADEIVNILNKEYGVNAEVDSAGFDSNKVYDIPQDDARDFLIQFKKNAKLISGFHKSVTEGVKTQICLWPHNFDYAFKWFSGRKINEEDEYIGAGFSNGDETYELPYLYMILWPELRKTNTLEIPEGAILHDQEWSGLLLPYEAVIEKNSAREQEELIKNYFEVSFKSIQRGFSKR